jgi:hypothetical protein
MTNTIYEISRIQNKCINHTELGFFERPLLYRQTNDDELQSKYRKKAYEKYYRYHNVRHIKMFNLVSHVYNIRYISNNIKLSKLRCSYLRGFDDYIKNHVLSYLQDNYRTFAYDKFVSIVTEDDSLVDTLFDFRNDRVMLALMLLRINYNTLDIDKNNVFISKMRTLNVDNSSSFSRIQELKIIYSFVCENNIDSSDDYIQIPHMMHIINELYL